MVAVRRWDYPEGISQRQSRAKKKKKIPEARKSLSHMKTVCRAQKTKVSMAHGRGGAMRSTKGFQVEIAIINSGDVNFKEQGFSKREGNMV